MKVNTEGRLPHQFTIAGDWEVVIRDFDGLSLEDFDLGKLDVFTLVDGWEDLEKLGS